MSDEVGERFDELQEIIDLAEWEDIFIEDMASRLDSYGFRTFVSERQWEVLERIRGKVQEDE
jgi:hypothetical protein